jgi:hypothetical protein
MGCDIHVHVEKKENDKWMEVNISKNIDIRARNYCIFSVLADVRNGYGIPPISYHRGIPKDSPNTHLSVDEDYHSHTWVSLKELLNYNWDIKLKNSIHEAMDVFGYFLEEVIPWLKTLGEPDNVRLVMAFDS